jgi:hypothetical protein
VLTFFLLHQSFWLTLSVNECYHLVSLPQLKTVFFHTSSRKKVCVFICIVVHSMSICIYTCTYTHTHTYIYVKLIPKSVKRRQKKKHILHNYIFWCQVNLRMCECVCVYYTGSLAVSINNFIITCKATQQARNSHRFCLFENILFLSMYSPLHISLRQAITMHFWLAWHLLCKPGWPDTHNILLPILLERGVKTYTTMPRLSFQFSNSFATCGISVGNYYFWTHWIDFLWLCGLSSLISSHVILHTEFIFSLRYLVITSFLQSWHGSLQKSQLLGLVFSLPWMNHLRFSPCSLPILTLVLSHQLLCLPGSHLSPPTPPAPTHSCSHSNLPLPTSAWETPTRPWKGVQSSLPWAPFSAAFARLPVSSLIWLPESHATSDSGALAFELLLIIYL